MVIFIELVQYAKDLGGKSRKNMVEHQIIKNDKKMKKVNKQCLLDTPRTVRVSEKTWQVIVQTSRP